MPEYVINADPTLLDREYIVRSLQGTYWATARARDVILASLDASLCFGVYQAPGHAQVGFARVVTDGATFSWLCDVFIDPAHRGRGLGKRLVRAVLSEPRVARTRVYLATQDAHTLYEPFGFERREVMRRGVVGPPDAVDAHG